MENKNKTQMIVGAIIVVVVLGLLIGAKRGNDYKAAVETGTESTASTTETVKTATVETPAKTTTTYKKPSGNVVQLTAKGFSPFILEIKRGESVEFSNTSDKTMVIRSYENKPENTYPGFAQTGDPLGKGGKFFFGFTTPGAWAYYNLNRPNDTGVIIVK